MLSPEQLLKLAAPIFSAEAAPLAQRLFSTKLGPTGAQALQNRSRAVTDRITQQGLARARALGDAAGPTSSKWLASRSGWNAPTLASPQFDSLFEGALKAAAAKKKDDDTDYDDLRSTLRSFAPFTDDVARRVTSHAKKRGAKRALEKFGMELAFDTPQEVQRHRDVRGLAQGAGALGGAYAGFKATPGGMGRKLLGGVIGGGLGHTGAGIAVDSAHDIPQRTRAQYDTTQQRLHAAGGVPALKLADIADDLVAAIAEGEGHEVGPGTESFAESELAQRTSSPSWGAVANVDGSGTQGGNMQTGAGMSYGGV